MRSQGTPLCDGFTQFFIDKIRKVNAVIQTRLADSVNDALQSDHRHIGPLLTDVRLPTTQEVYKLICSVPGKSSPLDKITSSVTNQDMRCDICAADLSITTLSFFQGKFPSCYMHASVTPLLKKQGLDSCVFSNYRPVSNLHTISIGRVISRNGRVSQLQIVSGLRKTEVHSVGW